jgi:lysophospholipase L1-like esterase
MDPKRSKRRKAGFAKIVAYNVAVVALLLVLIEGLASYGLLVRDAVATKSLAERRHTKYDPDLGWVNEPNVTIRDMYGPGVYLRTNAQEFRSNHDVQASLPDGKVRVVCSGDSFTFGYGVDNDHTWCELLSVLEPRFESVNMGQGGYGVDQAYLWYKRDGLKFEHRVQLFAFITEDFYRMLSDSFLGYDKPVLAVENGKLIVKNVPVPKQAYYSTWLKHTVGKLSGLRTVELVNRIERKVGMLKAKSQPQSQRERDRKAREILGKLFEDLKRLNEQRSSKLVLVYLPTLQELLAKAPQPGYSSEPWSEFLEEESSTLRIPLINLFDAFRSLSDDEMSRLFIPKGDLSYPGAAGHLNNAGNEFVARALHDKLVQIVPL